MNSTGSLRTTSVLLLVVSLAGLFAPRARGDTALHLELEGLVDRAGLIVEARVVEATGVRDAASGIVCTDYSLRVARTFFGEPLEVRTVRVPGGVLADGSGTLMPGFPRLAVGDEVVLFLTAPGRTGWRVPVGAAQGAYFVSTDELGVRRVGRNLAGLTRVAGGGDPASAGESDARLEFQSFAERVERAVVVKRERTAAEARGASTGDGR